MTRVSLKEAYDNKDVVAQIYAIRDTAESAEDTAEQAVTTANTASDHVDALVPQVEGAVQNANSASASAQASAQTVAGFENRLGAVETGLSTAQHNISAVEDNVEDLSGDLNTVTLRVQTAEGQIVTIQGRVTALETADGQNIKINAINDYAVGLTGNQTALGEKTWVGNQTLNRNLLVVRTGTDVTTIPASAFNTLVKEIYDGNSHLNASEFVTKNPNGATWNVRNFFHYFRDMNDTVHVVRVGVYYTIENTPTTATVKRVINIFVDGTSVSSETEYTKTVNL